MGLLRTLLAIAVVIGHGGGLWGYAITDGPVAVQCFYIISGFFIALVLNEKYTQPEDRPLFYTNRLLRIFSLYWLFFALAIAVAVAGYLVTHRGLIVTWMRTLSRLTPLDITFLGISNLVIVGQELPLYLRVGNPGLHWTSNFLASDPPVYQLMPLIQAWSLSLELMFYAIAPFIVRRRPWTIAAIALGSLGLRIAGHAYGLIDDPWSYRFFPFELSTFLAGALGYALYARIKTREPSVASRMFVGGLVVAVLLFPLYGEAHGSFFSPGRLFLYAYLALALPFLHRLTRNLRWDRLVGEISYPLYLCHTIVAGIVRTGTGSSSRLPPGRLAVMLIASIALSVFVVKTIDIPLDRFRQRRVRKRQEGAGERIRFTGNAGSVV
jgi:peptidoglycan/LPS O-acetylase OafA/YrhL